MNVDVHNPVAELKIDDYPLGGNKRGPARFWIEKADKGAGRGLYQIGRETWNPKLGRCNAPKYSTYSTKVAIVTGADGRTYLVQFSATYGLITVDDSAFKYVESFISGTQPGRLSPISTAYQSLLEMCDKAVAAFEDAAK